MDPSPSPERLIYKVVVLRRSADRHRVWGQNAKRAKKATPRFQENRCKSPPAPAGWILGPYAAPLFCAPQKPAGSGHSLCAHFTKITPKHRIQKALPVHTCWDGTECGCIPLCQGIGAGYGPGAAFAILILPACMPKNSERAGPGGAEHRRASPSIAEHRQPRPPKAFGLRLTMATRAVKKYFGSGGRVPAPFTAEKAATSGLCCWMSPSPLPPA